jgi:hypothetical protein
MLYTIRGKTDGFGAQYHAIMSGIAICSYNKWSYIHTPMTSIEHGVNVQQMNEFIGIPQSSRSIVNVSEAYSNTVHETDVPDIYYTDDVIKQIRGFYNSCPKPSLDVNDIVIHIRRGDITARNTERYTNNHVYKQIIRQLNERYPTYKITIHSQGNIEDFSDLISDNVSFSLNKDLRVTFHSMATAKVLIMSKSSLSYSAAILNDKEVYYMPFWHKPLKRWNIIS